MIARPTIAAGMSTTAIAWPTPNSSVLASRTDHERDDDAGRSLADRASPRSRIPAGPAGAPPGRRAGGTAPTCRGRRRGIRPATRASTGTSVARIDPIPATATPSRRSCIDPIRTCTQSPPRRPTVMPTVIRRNAALATPALEPKSTLSRNAAQSPLPTSSIIAVAPPSPSTIAAGPNRRRRIARSTSVGRHHLAAVQTLPDRRTVGRLDRFDGSMRLVDAQQAGHDEQRHRQQRHRHDGEVHLHADVGAVDEHRHDAARHRAEAPQPVQSVHHRDAPPRRAARSPARSSPRR